MNLQLVESLANAVVSLSQEDYVLFQDALTAKTIRKTPGVAGGVACIRNTRIAVWTLISLANQGADDAELALDFPGLTSFDFRAAKTYYQMYRMEIDSLIAENDREDVSDD